MKSALSTYFKIDGGLPYTADAMEILFINLLTKTNFQSNIQTRWSRTTLRGGDISNLEAIRLLNKWWNMQATDEEKHAIAQSIERNGREASPNFRCRLCGRADGPLIKGTVNLAKEIGLSSVLSGKTTETDIFRAGTGAENWYCLDCTISRLLDKYKPIKDRIGGFPSFNPFYLVDDASLGYGSIPWKTPCRLWELPKPSPERGVAVFLGRQRTGEAKAIMHQIPVNYDPNWLTFLANLKTPKTSVAQEITLSTATVEGLRELQLWQENSLQPMQGGTGDKTESLFGRLIDLVKEDSRAIPTNPTPKEMAVVLSTFSFEKAGGKAKKSDA